jgi:hypothetical protein
MTSMVSSDLDRAPALTPWDVFVLRHTKPANLWIHVVSFAMFWGGPLAALVLWEPWPLVFFVVSGGVGGLGHKVTGDSGVNLREATSSPLVVFYASKLVVLHLMGRYAEHIARAQERAKRVQM